MPATHVFHWIPQLIFRAVNLITGVWKPPIESMPRLSFLADTRAAYFPISYALTLGITVLLLSGIMTGTGAFVDQKTDNAANSELQVIGDRVATQLMAVDQQATHNDDLEMTVELGIPGRAAGSHYNIRIRNEPEGGTDTLQLWSISESAAIEIPLDISLSVAEATVVSDDNLVISLDGPRITIEADHTYE